MKQCSVPGGLVFIFLLLAGAPVFCLEEKGLPGTTGPSLKVLVKQLAEKENANIIINDGRAGVSEDEAFHLVSRSNGFLCEKLEDTWVMNDGRILAEGKKTLSYKTTAESG